MAYRTSNKVHKVMIQPINVIFRHLQNRTRVAVWLFEASTKTNIEGVIIGFDEFMNIVLDEAEEVTAKKGQEEQRRTIGRILLKGDNVSVIRPLLRPISEG